jgi:hypothetical protein
MKGDVEMETRKILVVVSVVVLMSGMVLAGEWWVDPNGSDSNSGGENDPFATIRKALWQCSDDANDIMMMQMILLTLREIQHWTLRCTRRGRCF